eukprot:Selendium_serpulae@DN6098_c1_g2_i3.p1
MKGDLMNPATTFSAISVTKKKDNWLYAVEHGAKDVTFQSIEVAEEINRKKTGVEDSARDGHTSVNSMLQQLISYLQPNETPLTALKRIKSPPAPGTFILRRQRLNTNGTPSTSTGDSTKPISSNEVVVKSEDADSEKEAVVSGKQKQPRPKRKVNRMSEEQTAIFNSITELCDALMSEGRNVYGSRRDELESMMNTQETKSDEWMISWQFRWLSREKDDEKKAHGPISSTEI